MKSCPTCNRTYSDDTITFCLVDGSILSAPYDPAATKSSGPARETNPPATEVFNPGASLNSWPPSQAAPKDLQSTIRAPYQPPLAHQQSAQRAHDYLQGSSNYPPRKSSVVKKVLIGLAVFVVLLIGLFVFLEVMFATHRSTVQNVMPSGTLEEDEAKTREQLRGSPYNAELNQHLVTVLLKEGKFAEAELAARKAIGLNPNTSAPHFTLAKVLRARDKKAEADAEEETANKLAASGQ